MITLSDGVYLVSQIQLQSSNIVVDNSQTVQGILQTLSGAGLVTNASGIAVVGVDTQYGMWQAYISGQWQDISQVSNGSALILGASTQLRVYNKSLVFQNNDIGDVPITIKAWDGQGAFDGTFINTYGATQLYLLIQQLPQLVHAEKGPV